MTKTDDGQAGEQVSRALGLAVELHREEQFGRALSLYQGVLAQQPDHPTALNLAGIASERLGRREDARKLVERAAALPEPDPTSLRLLGGLAEADESFAEAAEACLLGFSSSPEQD